jgi:hypothetical protein
LINQQTAAASSAARIAGFLRYSVVTEANIQQFKRTKGSGLQEAYARVFDDGRMAARAALFEALTLPCFLHQANSGVPFTLNLLVSPACPPKWRERLELAIEGASFIRITEVAPDEEVPAVCDRIAFDSLDAGQAIVTTFRIDDDDCVCDDYIAQLAAASVPSNAGRVHSFNNGFYAGLDVEERFYMYRRSNTNNAWGLAFIAGAEDGRSIFTLGRHSKIFQAAPVIVNKRPNAWIRSVHDVGDRFTLPVTVEADWLRQADAEAVAPGNFSFLDFGKVEAAFRVARAGAAG